MKKLAISLALSCFCFQGNLISDEAIDPQLKPIMIPQEVLTMDRNMQLLEQWETSQHICTNYQQVDGATTATCVSCSADC